jgi:4-amino-4-deoxy-L-arabinose transferase-like glycosyltransferase
MASAQQCPRVSSPRHTSRRGRTVLGSVIVTLVLAILWFAQIEQRQLLEPDEGRYAEIPREMVATGDWITPRLNDLLYFEKPPLQYWTTAAAYELFGQHNWTARLWCVLTGLAGVALIFYTGRRVHSNQAGIYAALMLSSSVLYFGGAHINTLDMGLTLFLEMTAFALVLSRRPGAPALEARVWIHVAWLAAGLAILSKGLVGILLPAAVFTVYSVVYRDAATWKKLSPSTGVPLMLLVALPWFVAVMHSNPDFAYFFFVHEHFTRFLTSEHHRHEPWWFFMPVLFIGALPWTVSMLESLIHALRTRIRNESFHAYGFLAVWIIIVFAFFSVSNSKLVSYILPLFPPLALLAGIRISEAGPNMAARQILVSAGAALLIFAVALLVLISRSAQHPVELRTAHAAWLMAGIVLWCGGTVCAFVATRKGKIGTAIAIMTITALAVYQLALIAFDRLGPVKSTFVLAQQIKPYLNDTTTVYAVQMYPQALPVYLGRTLTLVDYQGELAFGLDREPHKGIATLPAFQERWRTGHDEIAVMYRETFDALAAARLPMEVIGADPRRVAVRRP